MKVKRSHKRGGIVVGLKDKDEQLLAKSSRPAIPAATPFRLDQLMQTEVGPGAPARAFSRKGGPADEIVAAAKELQVDLTILSTHGYSGIKHMLMGSTAENLVRHAPCPVLVVREHEHEFVVE